MPPRDDVDDAPASELPITGVELLSFLKACVAVERSRAENLTAGDALRASGHAKTVRWIARELVASAVLAGVQDGATAMVAQGAALKRLEGAVQGNADRIPYTAYRKLVDQVAAVKAAYLAQVAAAIEKQDPRKRRGAAS
jgi:hypothetical protein